MNCDDCKKYIEFIDAWKDCFNEFMVKYNDMDIVNDKSKIREMIDELSIQLEAFMGW